MNKTTLQKNTNTDTNSSTSVPVNMYFSRSWSGNQFKEITKIFSILSIFQTNKKLRVCYLFERSKSQVTQLHKMFVIKTSPMLAKESSMLLRNGTRWSAATRLLLSNESRAENINKKNLVNIISFTLRIKHVLYVASKNFWKHGGNQCRLRMNDEPST